MTQSQQLIHVEFSDVEIFSSVSNGWDIDFRLLEAGPFKADLLQFVSSEFHFASTGMNRKIDQQGASPDSFWTFAVLMTPLSDFQWHGSITKMNEIMVYKPFSEINTISKNPFRVLIYSVLEERLESRCDNLRYDSVLKILRSTDKVTCNPSDVNILRQELFRLDTFFRAGCMDKNDKKIGFSEIESAVFEALIRCLVNSRRPIQKKRKKLKDHALRQSLACIEMQLGETLTVSGLCQTAGVSDRTLQQAFKEHFGISPKSYIKILRLNRLHRQLVEMGPGKVSISTLANQWGFWHMGQLARDYRELFGELPSTTLNKTKEESIAKKIKISDF